MPDEVLAIFRKVDHVPLDFRHVELADVDPFGVLESSVLLPPFDWRQQVPRVPCVDVSNLEECEFAPTVVVVLALPVLARFTCLDGLVQLGGEPVAGVVEIPRDVHEHDEQALEVDQLERIEIALEALQMCVEEATDPKARIGLELVLGWRVFGERIAMRHHWRLAERITYDRRVAPVLVLLPPF